MSEAERKTIKGELNELWDDKEERRQTLSGQEVVEQPDVGQLIESVAKLNWTEASGKCFVGSGFLAKITLGVEDRLGFFTAGHNLYDKGTKQLVKASDIKLRFKAIRKHTIKVAFSKFLRQNYLLIVAYQTTKIISRNGQESTQPCRKGLDFGAVIFTDPVDRVARFLCRLGLSYLQVASPGACSSAPTKPVQLVGFPQYEENYSPMRILPGNELVVTPGNIPDHCYDLETEPGASGGSVLDKGGRVIAVHIRGQNRMKGDQGNWGLGFDLIREELQLAVIGDASIETSATPSDSAADTSPVSLGPTTEPPVTTTTTVAVLTSATSTTTASVTTAATAVTAATVITTATATTTSASAATTPLEERVASQLHLGSSSSGIIQGTEPREEKLKIVNTITYNQNERIGDGGSSKVYKGMYNGKKVAVKKVDKDVLKHAEENREATILDIAGHENIVKCLATEQDDSFYYLALSLCKTDLSNAVRDPSVIKLDVITLLKEVTKGMEFIHSKTLVKPSIVHRDIKPSNVLLYEDEETGVQKVMLGDFGLSKKAKPGVSYVSIQSGCGTKGWKSIEVMKLEDENVTDRNVSVLSDIFPLGCLFYFVLTNGKHPFQNENETERHREINIWNGKYNLDALDEMKFPHARSLIEKMISSNPKDRPRATQILDNTMFKSMIRKGKITYNANERLGDGATSKVFKGAYEGRVVAVKKIEKDCFRATDYDKEASILNMIQHENVMKCFGTEEDDSFCYLALSLCISDFANIIKDPAVCKLDVITLLEEATKGIEFIHSKSETKSAVAHRDIKPNNILIYEDELTGAQKVLIGDFGLSKKATSSLNVSIRSGCGTQGWKAKELMEREDLHIPDRKISIISDIFSLGCVYYYMLANGRHPFQKDTQRDLHRELNILNGEYNLDALDEANIPHCRELIERMISSNPKDRPTASEVLENPMFNKMGSQERSLLSLSKFVKLFKKRHVAPAPVCNSVDAFGNPAHSCRFIQSFHSDIGAYFFRSINTIIGRDWVKKIRNRFEDGTISPQDTVVVLSGTHGPRTALTDSTKAVFNFIEEDKSFISKMKSTHPKIELVDVGAYHLRPEDLKKKVLELNPKFIIFAFCDSDGSKQCTCDVKQLFCRNEEERNILDE